MLKILFWSAVIAAAIWLMPSGVLTWVATALGVLFIIWMAASLSGIIALAIGVIAICTLTGAIADFNGSGPDLLQPTPWQIANPPRKAETTASAKMSEQRAKTTSASFTSQRPTAVRHKTSVKSANVSADRGRYVITPEQQKLLEELRSRTFQSGRGL